ncbi:5'-adenylylsulfate reductase-like 4 [Bidens hawaiensis]|uniref:5'-adenylylsulfate reductase-like 4 n=1 Tax=Bidens hawaiensis TaxID=980011 RepID=UPI004049AD0F
MRQTIISQLGLVLLVLLFGTLTCAEEIEVSNSMGPPKLIIFSSQSPICPFDNSSGAIAVIEGDESSLQKALNTIHKNTQSYVVILFYASWCPFSITFRPKLSIMASLYPSISHFAFEESVIRPSILSKYGVHGFPTLFVLNSTMHARYHGSRTIGSLMTFYTNVTGILRESINGTSLGETIYEHDNQNMKGPDRCPFSWARSPENMLQHETYLTLATIFVVLRLLYWRYPYIMARARVSWTRRIPDIRFKSLWEHPLSYMKRAIQLFTSLTEPCKRSNLRGPMNAKAKAVWDSKSLASVSFGKASTSRD